MYMNLRSNFYYYDLIDPTHSLHDIVLVKMIKI